MKRARIVGTGRYLPEGVLTNADLEQRMDTSDAWIRQRTGIHQRRYALNGAGSSDLGVPAALRARESAELSPEDVEMIVCATTTPDYLFPGTGCMIQRKIGATRAAAVDVNAACTGFVYALATADAYIRSGMYRTVLVVATERIVNRLNWNKRDTAVLFGDGAGAVVLRATTSSRGILSTYLMADGAQSDLLLVPAGGSVSPDTPMDEHSQLYDIEMKGRDLYRKAVAAFGDAVERALALTGMGIEDVDLFVPHQANVRIVSAAAERVGQAPEKIYMNIDQVGNTIAASIPLALDQANEEGRLHEGAHVLLAAFGAGLTWGSAMVRW